MKLGLLKTKLGAACPKGQTPVRWHSGKRIKNQHDLSITNQGKVRFMFYEGSMNAKMFIRFLRRLVTDASKKYI